MGPRRRGDVARPGDADGSARFRSGLPPGARAARDAIVTAMAKRKTPQAVKLVNLAQQLYDFHIDDVRRDVIAVPRKGSRSRSG
jgi:hypothetical protein